MTQTADRTKPAIIRFSREADLEVWPAIPADEVLEGNPLQRGLTLLDEPEFGLSAGLWDCTSQTSAWIYQPSHEFMILLEGEVTIVEASGETTFRAGDAFILPQGLHCQWRQPGYVRKVWVAFEDVSGPTLRKGMLRAIRVDASAPSIESAPPAPPILLSDAPSQHLREVFSDPTGQFSVGVWDTTSYERKHVPFDRWELMHIVDGGTVLTDDEGGAESIEVGDTILAPFGSVVAWRGDRYLRKIYCSFTPMGVVR